MALRVCQEEGLGDELPRAAWHFLILGNLMISRWRVLLNGRSGLEELSLLLSGLF